MRTHLVWATGAEGTTVLYCGEDAVAAEQAYEAQHLNGHWDSVRWSYEVRHNKHTTPAKDGCAVVAPVKEEKSKKGKKAE